MDNEMFEQALDNIREFATEAQLVKLRTAVNMGMDRISYEARGKINFRDVVVFKDPRSAVLIVAKVTGVNAKTISCEVVKLLNYHGQGFMRGCAIGTKWRVTPTSLRLATVEEKKGV